MKNLTDEFISAENITEKNKYIIINIKNILLFPIQYIVFFLINANNIIPMFDIKSIAKKKLPNFKNWKIKI